MTLEGRQKEEARMAERLGAQRGRWVGAAALALAVRTALGVVGSATARNAAGCGTVTLNEQAWAGSTANTYVAKNVLQKIGCNVKITQITEIPVYQAMADGKVDAVLEDWQHVDQYKQYVDKQKTVVKIGPNGVQGVIGWYIPDYLMKAHPEFKTWKGLKGKESLFKSPESGSQGMFLGGDPSYVQKDKELIPALRAKPKVRLGRRRAGPGRTLEPALQAAQAGALLLVRPAVPERDLQARPDPVAEAFRQLQGRREGRRQPEGVRVRIPVVHTREALLEEVRYKRLPRRRGAEAVDLDEPGPERGREADRPGSHDPRQGRAAVDLGHPGKAQHVARKVAA